MLKVIDVVFEVLELYGMKINFKKTIWCSRMVKFLGFMLEGGEISIEEYLQKKQQTLGEI